MRQPAEVRVNRIFSLLADGVKSAEIIRIEEERRRPFQERLERGNSSEQNVSEALTGLPVVTRVNKVPTNSVGDQSGIDLVVGLKTDTPEAIVGKVKVQVKSSESGITTFREKVKSDNSLKDGEVDDWLTSNGWIVLNGQMPKDDIAHDFLAQLKKINDFARTEETKADRDDIKTRITDQARRYLDHRRNRTLTPQWEEWGRKHPFEIAKIVY